MCPDISLASRDQLFLSLGIVLAASSVSIITQFLNNEQRNVALIVVIIAAVLSLAYGFKLLADKEKRKVRSEITEIKLKIADLIIIREKITDQKYKNKFIFVVHRK